MVVQPAIQLHSVRNHPRDYTVLQQFTRLSKVTATYETAWFYNDLRDCTMLQPSLRLQCYNHL
jgi:hypothetical protein